MKILIVSKLYPPMVTASDQLLCQGVVEKLRTRGHQVEVLTSDFLAETVAPVKEIHRKLHLTTDFQGPDEGAPTLARVSRINAWHTADLLDELAPDLVFCWSLNRLGTGPLLEAQRRGIPVTYAINDEYSSLSDLAQLRAPSIAVKTEALKRELLDQGAPVERAEVIHQGLPLEKFSYKPALRAPGQTFKLLYVGRLSRTQGVETLLETLPLVDPGVHLTLVGEALPDYRRELDEIVKRHRIQKRIRFLGWRFNGQVVADYHSHHALVFPSGGDELFGPRRLEVMACGCPLVSTTRGGNAELLREGRNALPYVAGDPRSLALQISRLVADEPFRRALAEQAREYVARYHSMDVYVDRLESWLMKAKDNHPSWEPLPG